MTTVPTDQIHTEVQQRYGKIAEEFQVEVKASCCDTTSTAGDACCSSDLYSADTSWLPEDVVGLSLGCGDPITLATLEEGQTVLDLGSGGGIDCFMAARQVGESGHVIGVDMTPAMLEKAERNRAKVGLTNVEFRKGQIEALPVDDNTIDVIISNCVINLSPDKPTVFRESFRVLKPGGRLAVSDMVTRGVFSAEARSDMNAWSDCVSGAEPLADYVGAIKAAGFVNIEVRDKATPDVVIPLDSPLTKETQLFSALVSAEKPA